MALTVLILHALVRPSKDLRRWWWVQIPLAAAFMLLLEYLWSVHPAAAVAAGIATFLLLFAWHRHRTPQAPPVLRAPGN
jgi:hypothetical protein